jgi:hypothetical protein
MWLSAKIARCFGSKTLLNIMRQCKLRFLDINMHIIEQNIHVLYNMMSYECHPRRLVAGEMAVFLTWL